MPSFLSKFVKAPPSLSGSHKRRSHSRSGSTSSVNSSSHGRKNSQPSIAVSPPTVDPPRLSSDSAAAAVSNQYQDQIAITVPSGYESSSSSNPNVHIIPPSPHSSDVSFPEDPTTPKSVPPPPPSKQIPHRHTHTLSLGSRPLSPTTEEAEDAITPTSPRPIMPERAETLRPLSHASSTGDLRGQTSPSRATTFVAPASVSKGQSKKLGVSPKSSRTGLRIKLTTEPTPTPSQFLAPLNRHERSATSPPTIGTPSQPGEDDGTMVESPTGLHSQSFSEFAPPKPPSLSPSATMPATLSSSTFLSANDNSDVGSINSIGTGSKKRRPWRRSSVNKEKDKADGVSNNTNALSPPVSASTSGSKSPTKSPKRRPTGLAGALAASGLVMANPGALMPQISPSDTPSSTRAIAPRSARSNSMTSSAGTYSHFPKTPPSRGSRSRQPSLNYPASDGMSDRDSFHSGMDGSSASSDDELEDDLDLDPDDIPVTGFAVASNRRNQEFHEMFSNIPEGDYLIEDYGCALQREILIQGRLYISENHVCFHANIFGWVTDLSIPMYEVSHLDKRMTAFVIPNAIQVTTRNAKYTFTSFLSRDTTYDVMYNVWRLARPEDSSISSQFTGRGSLDTPIDPLDPLENGDANGTAVAGRLPNGNGVAKKVNKVTQCACGRAGQHFSEVAMESTLPGTPEKIYNLMFTSGFIKDFMRDDQKLLDIQISDWMPLPDHPKLLSRNMSYIKPLTASIGPKQTKCELRDETVHCDFDEYVVMLTTTRTPDVPSGGVFSVKTRTCITWASNVTTKILVTTQVEWTGRSFIKGIIEKSCIDGQKTYHSELERAMRDYIHKHQSEFVPEGVDVAEVEETAEAQGEALKTPVLDKTPLSEEQAAKEREHERNRRSMQWAYDTFEGAFKVAKQSTEGALELIRDAWDQSSSVTILYFVIAILVVSNIWTLMMMGKREEVGRRKELRRMEEREKWVQGVVTALWDELTTTRGGAPSPNPYQVVQQPSVGGSGVSGGSLPPFVRPPGGAANWREEVTEINRALDMVEERVAGLKESMKDLKDLD